MSASPPLPELFWLAQDLSGPVVEAPAARAAEALDALQLGARVTAGQTVAVAVGSRGIANLQAVVRATVEHLRHLGVEPFVVPAMGSHGGGTAVGQEQVLAGYGITEAGVGCPVRAQMDVVELCRSALGVPIFFDRLAAEADHVVVVNRVKPHTHFEGALESGLAKMLLIGLGKREGATTFHRATFDDPWSQVAASALPALLASTSVLAAIALVENAADGTARIEALSGEEIIEREPALLAEARTLLPRLPFDDFDILLIDQIGKNISGSGFDTNTVGRKGSLHEIAEKQPPRVQTVIVRGLTPETRGNALGVGLAELCRTRVVDEMDRPATNLNALTSGDLPAGMVPIHFDTDRELLAACTTRTGLRDLAEARLGWIRNTLDLGVVACSAALLDAARERTDLQVLTGVRPLPLDEAGNLPDLVPTPESPDWDMHARP